MVVILDVNLSKPDETLPCVWKETRNKLFPSGYKMLLILTNVGQQMKNLRQYWPQHGDEQWGDTQV